MDFFAKSYKFLHSSFENSITKVTISIGLASNATGRLHLNVIEKIDQLLTASPATQKPYFILDGTHYVPHRRTDLNSFKSADAIICSAYKFFGPHIGVMAFKG